MIVIRNKDLIREAHLIVAIVDKASHGVGGEVVYAHEVIKRPIFAISFGRPVSAWIDAHATVVKTLKQLMDEVQAEIGEWDESDNYF